MCVCLYVDIKLVVEFNFHLHVLTSVHIKIGRIKRLEVSRVT